MKETTEELKKRKETLNRNARTMFKETQEIDKELHKRLMMTILENGLLKGDWQFIWFNTRLDNFDELQRSEIKLERMAEYNVIDKIFRTFRDIIGKEDDKRLWFHLDLDEGSEKPYHERDKLEVNIRRNDDHYNYFARTKMTISVKIGSDFMSIFKKYGIKIFGKEKLTEEIDMIEKKFKQLKEFAKE